MHKSTRKHQDFSQTYAPVVLASEIIRWPDEREGLQHLFGPPVLDSMHILGQ